MSAERSQALASCGSVYDLSAQAARSPAKMGAGSRTTRRIRAVPNQDPFVAHPLSGVVPGATWSVVLPG